MIVRRCAGYALQLRPCRASNVSTRRSAYSLPLLDRGRPALIAQSKPDSPEGGPLEIAS